MSRGGRGGGGGGGSRGSRSSGGFRSSSRGYSSGGYYYRRPMRFRRYGFWGPTVVLTSGYSSAISVIIFLMFFAFILCIGGFGNVSDCKDHMRELREDYAYYQTFIENAEEHNWFIEGRVVNFDSVDNKYYLEYEVKNPETNQYITWYPTWYDDCVPTYAVYTLNEALEYQGETIILCHNDSTLTIDAYTDTIPYDFKGKKVEDDGDYILDQKDVGVYNCMGWISVGAMILGVVGIVVILSRAKKEDEGSLNKTATVLDQELAATNTVSDTATTQAEHHTYCDYCGSKLDRSATNCPNCGSKLQKK